MDVGFLVDKPDRHDDGGGHLRVADGAHLHHRLHGGGPGYQRFFSYISLFTFSMLMLVMSNNFLQLFFGWEAVGLVSYLLIGFWYKKPTAIFANMKAFLVNRVGDFGFILGIGLIVAYAGTLDYAEVFAKAGELGKLTVPRQPTGC
jgi:NADH-quinone oxidoreductase subunit L